MITSINWARLVNSGRAKAIGISWNEKELVALKAGVSVEDVRAGILSKEEDEIKPTLERMKRDDLITMAKEFGVIFDEKVITRETLIAELKNAEAPKAEPELPKEPETPGIPEEPETPEKPAEGEEAQG